MCGMSCVCVCVLSSWHSLTLQSLSTIYDKSAKVPSGSGAPGPPDVPSSP